MEDKATGVQEQKSTAEEASPSAADQISETGDAAEKEGNHDTGSEFVDGVPASEKKPEQTKAENAAFAARRREQETARKVRDAETNAIIEALDGVNPYTGRAMKDAFDVDEFRRMRALEKKGGNVHDDYAETVKQEQRARAAREKQQADEEEWYRNDLSDFRKKHGDVDLQVLIADEQFGKFADGKLGKKPLSEIYEDFSSLRESITKAEKTRLSRAAANAKASPGALHDANQQDPGFYTRDQVRAMSSEEVHKNYEKIRESMARWK